MKIDLNIDIGEGGTSDEALLALASSANIGCGGHAGGGEVMRVAIERARGAGVAIGAHPGYRDRANFGRLETGDPVARVVDEMRSQLIGFSEALGGGPHHVKFHGALYHRADSDAELAGALCGLLGEVVPDAMVYAFAGGGFGAAAAAHGRRVCGEGFIDRRYAPDGSLIARGEPGAEIETPEEAAAQALRLAMDGRIHTLCVHGDGARAVRVLSAARRALLDSGLEIGPVRA